MAYNAALEKARAEKTADPPIIRGKVNFSASLGRFNDGENIENFSSPVRVFCRFYSGKYKFKIFIPIIFLTLTLSEGTREFILVLIIF